jgi:nitrogen-specific signal transduction histidine kinase/ActR/RegA family two-component response regulator
VRDAQDRVTNLLYVLRDVTREESLERELRRSQKMEALGTLAGGIAHDFNNLLVPMLMGAELAVMQLPEESPARLSLERVIGAAGRARDLIRQILNFSRMQESDASPVRLDRVVAEAVDMCASTMPSHIQVGLDLDSDAAVSVDPAQLHQVLMNLCANAAHAMAAAGGRLNISLRGVDLVHGDVPPGEGAPGPHVRLRVADTGPGMAQEVLERAFDPFFTTKKPGEGTGLGLPMVHRIVRNHGGFVILRSAPDQGAVFDIFLPALPPEQALPPSETEAGVAAAVRPARVLLVDDEDELRHTVREALAAAGHRVEDFADPLEALARLEEAPDRFDLLLTDQTMPGLTGLDLAERSRALAPGAPVLLMTGYSAAATPERLERAGVDRLLTKPFDTQALLRAVQEALASASEEDR